MPKHSSIFLFSKTPHPDVNHIPILVSRHLHESIDFSRYDYIIASSKETLEALEKIGEWKQLPVLAISEATARFVQKKGARLLDVAEGSGSSIVALIQRKYAGLRALYPHAKQVAFDIEGALHEKQIDVDGYSVYETGCSEEKSLRLPEDAICIFTSPSAVRCFQEQYGFLNSYRIVCIGQTTRSALPKGIECVLSESSSVEATIECALSLQS